MIAIIVEKLLEQICKAGYIYLQASGSALTGTVNHDWAVLGLVEYPSGYWTFISRFVFHLDLVAFVSTGYQCLQKDIRIWIFLLTAKCCILEASKPQSRDLRPSPSFCWCSECWPSESALALYLLTAGRACGDSEMASQIRAIPIGTIGLDVLRQHFRPHQLTAASSGEVADHVRQALADRIFGQEGGGRVSQADCSSCSYELQCL